MSSYHRIEHGLKDSLSQGQQSRWLRNIGHQQASFSQLHSLKRSGSNKAITFLRIVYPKLYENYSLLGWSNLFLVCPVWFRKNTSTFAILKIACQTSVIGALNGGFRCDTRDTRGDWKTLPSPSRALLQNLCAPITPIIKTIFKEKNSVSIIPRRKDLKDINPLWAPAKQNVTVVNIARLLSLIRRIALRYVTCLRLEAISTHFSSGDIQYDETLYFC